MNDGTVNIGGNPVGVNSNSIDPRTDDGIGGREQLDSDSLGGDDNRIGDHKKPTARQLEVEVESRHVRSKVERLLDQRPDAASTNREGTNRNSGEANREPRGNAYGHDSQRAHGNKHKGSGESVFPTSYERQTAPPSTSSRQQTSLPLNNNGQQFPVSEQKQQIAPNRNSSNQANSNQAASNHRDQRVPLNDNSNQSIANNRSEQVSSNNQTSSNNRTSSSQTVSSNSNQNRQSSLAGDERRDSTPNNEPRVLTDNRDPRNALSRAPEHSNSANYRSDNNQNFSNSREYANSARGENRTPPDTGRATNTDIASNRNNVAAPSDDSMRASENPVRRQQPQARSQQTQGQQTRVNVERTPETERQSAPTRNDGRTNHNRPDVEAHVAKTQTRGNELKTDFNQTSREPRDNAYGQNAKTGYGKIENKSRGQVFLINDEQPSSTAERGGRNVSNFGDINRASEANRSGQAYLDGEVSPAAKFLSHVDEAKFSSQVNKDQQSASLFERSFVGSAQQNFRLGNDPQAFANNHSEQTAWHSVAVEYLSGASNGKGLSPEMRKALDTVISTLGRNGVDKFLLERNENALKFVEHLINRAGQALEPNRFFETRPTFVATASLFSADTEQLPSSTNKILREFSGQLLNAAQLGQYFGELEKAGGDGRILQQAEDAAWRFLISNVNRGTEGSVAQAELLRDLRSGAFLPASEYYSPFPLTGRARVVSEMMELMRTLDAIDRIMKIMEACAEEAAVEYDDIAVVQFVVRRSNTLPCV